MDPDSLCTCCKHAKSYHYPSAAGGDLRSGCAFTSDRTKQTCKCKSFTDVIDVPTAKQSRMRRFVLERDEDHTGTSGTGVVAEGVETSNGHVFMTWISQHQSWTHYDNAKVLATLHGHGGKTRVVWLDPEVL